MMHGQNHIKLEQFIIICLKRSFVSSSTCSAVGNMAAQDSNNIQVWSLKRKDFLIHKEM